MKKEGSVREAHVDVKFFGIREKTRGEVDKLRANHPR
jgi:hypothetical protein